MRRRRFLKRSTVPVMVGALAGCTESDDSIQDSDGDGVIDSKDYAPNDPEVQEKSDINGATSTAAPTATPVPSDSPTDTPTETPTPTTSPPPTDTPTATESNVTGRVEADWEPIQEDVPAYFRWYSHSSAKLTFRRSLLDESKLKDEMDVLVTVAGYPNGDVDSYDQSGSVYIGNGTTTAELSYDISFPEHESFYITAYLMPTDIATEDLASDDLVYLCETDQLAVEGGSLVKNQHSEAKDTIETEGYSRISGEGMYSIAVKGTESFKLTVYKSAYIQYNQKAVGRAVDVIRESVVGGVASAFARIVNDEAMSQGYTGARQKVNYAVGAIQSFPYTSDTIEGDYNKYPIETLVESGGDCEDTVILLAAALSGEPFEYGTALIYLPYEAPDHVGLGVKGDESVQGTYYTQDDTRYYYVETTGEGWEVGELPDEYSDMSARVVVV